MTAATTVVDRADASRYEILSDGEFAGFVDYRHQDDHIVLIHVEIEPAFAGQGMAFTLAQGVFEDLRARGRLVDPQCPFMARWLGKHPEYSDVVVAGGAPAPEVSA
jgi:predicted GNAT family acetyltransferase